MPFRPDTAYRQRDNPAAPELRVLAAQLQALFSLHVPAANLLQRL